MTSGHRDHLLPIDRSILGHDEQFWGRKRVEAIPVLPDLSVARVQDPRGFFTYASIGAWRATWDEGHGVEFVGVSGLDDSRVMSHIASTARYHSAGPGHRLALGHTVPLGEGWVPDSPLNVILITRPHLWGPALEHCQLSDRHIQVLWLLPITESEREFKRAFGLDALEERFETARINYLDAYRAPVA